MTNLIKRCYFTYLFPARDFYFFSFFLFLLFLFLLSFFLFEFDSQVCKLKLDHIIYHFLNLVLNFRKNSLFDFSGFRFIFSASLIFPLFCMLLYLLLHYQHCLSGSTSRVILLKLVFFSKFLFLFFTFSLLFLFGFS